MPKARTNYVCQQCGAMSIKWQGRCVDCGQWNTLVEEVEAPRRATLSPQSAGGSAPVALRDVQMQNEQRFSTRVLEFDRVAGGGLVPGSLVLVGGAPGIGKSTLLLQVADGVSRGGGTVLYACGEESLGQVRMRAERLGVSSPSLMLLAETGLESILAHAQKMRPRILMVDSIQTVYSSEIASAPGSVGQVRECTAALMRLAKGEGVTVLLTGHVTKDGSIAGPRVMEHLVDTVLYFEGDGPQNYRILKAVKNRFGPTSEMGLFEMGAEGLIDVPNASEFLLSQRVSGSPGCCIVPVLEGTRAVCLEVQALCISRSTQGGYPARRANGIDPNRLAMLLAVLEKRAGLSTVSSSDVFINVAGGLHIEEPAADLATLAAVASSVSDVPLADGTAVLGEVGLGGEIRAVPQIGQRVTECARMGFQRLLVPAVNAKARGGLPTPSAMRVLTANHLSEALDQLLPGWKRSARSQPQKQAHPEWVG